VAVIIHPDVGMQIAHITGGNELQRSRIILDLNELELDPEPPRDGWRVTSSRVQFLRRRGFDIRRLRLETNLPNYRFFYHWDQDHEVVYVMEVVRRNPRTYDRIEEPHIRSVIAKYEEYYRRELWRT
jgi:mRNA-degrading endonuclease RelE of RelBE toxin-antitoxin system